MAHPLLDSALLGFSLIAGAFAPQEALGAVVPANAPFEIEAELELQGHKPFSGKIIANEGELAVIQTHDSGLKLLVKRDPNGSLVIETQVQKVQFGVPSTTKTPRFITELGKPAELIEKTGNGELVYRLKILVNKKETEASGL